MTATRWYSHASLVGLLSALAVAGSGCYGAYRGRVVATTPTVYASSPGVVYQAPPPPRTVYAQPQPYADAQWVERPWEWNGAQYVWVDGCWMQARPGYL